MKDAGDAVDQGMFTVTILKGTNILGTATCTTSDVNPGAVATANCFSGDDFVPGWTEISIENAFCGIPADFSSRRRALAGTRLVTSGQEWPPTCSSAGRN